MTWNANCPCQPLSSVRPDGERVGRLAACLLARRLQGDTAAVEPTGIAPICVTRRGSTDCEITDDPLIRAVLAYIDANLTKGIGVTDVLDAVHTGRRSLERRFLDRMGEPIGALLRRKRQHLARQLLRTTDLSVAAVARTCGYANERSFCLAFTQANALTPSAWRSLVGVGQARGS